MENGRWKMEDGKGPAHAGGDCATLRDGKWKTPFRQARALFSIFHIPFSIAPGRLAHLFGISEKLCIAEGHKFR